MFFVRYSRPSCPDFGAGFRLNSSNSTKVASFPNMPPRWGSLSGFMLFTTNMPPLKGFDFSQVKLSPNLYAPAPSVEHLSTPLEMTHFVKGKQCFISIFVARTPFRAGV